MAKPHRILLLVEPSTSYGRKVLRGVASFARMRKTWLFEFELLAKIDELLARGLSHADAVIIRGAQRDWVEQVVQSGLPAVNVSAELPSFDLPSVISDNASIGQLAAKHLLGRGFRQFACCGLGNRANFDQRIRSFVQTVEEAGFPCRVLPESDRPFEPLLSDEQAATLRLWLRRLPRPSGLLAGNDEMGRLLTELCRQLEIRVPEDLAIIGVDNDEVVCELSSPPLSSIDHGAERVGYTAAKLLSRLMMGQKPPPRPILIQPVGVVTRRSTEILAIDEPVVAECVRYIRENVERKIEVEDLVRHSGVSRRWLEICFRRALGRPPAAEIRRAQVELAKRLLTETDMLMPAIAAASGFTDAKLLIAVFRREVGQTPTAYRRQFRLT